jgi:hypothetical protein
MRADLHGKELTCDRSDHWKKRCVHRPHGRPVIAIFSGSSTLAADAIILEWNEWGTEASF